MQNNIITNEFFQLNIVTYKPNHSVSIAYSLQKLCIDWRNDYTGGNFDNVTSIEIS